MVSPWRFGCGQKGAEVALMSAVHGEKAAKASDLRLVCGLEKHRLLLTNVLTLRKLAATTCCDHVQVRRADPAQNGTMRLADLPTVVAGFNKKAVFC